MRRQALVSFVVVLALGGLAHAGQLVWDESIHGDLSDDDQSPTVLVFAVAGNVVKGQIGGPLKSAFNEVGPEAGDNPQAFDDGYDVYTFDVPAGHRLVDVVLGDYRPTPGNTSTGFNMWSGTSGSLGTLLGTAVMTEDAIGTDLLGAARIGALGPGSYTIELREGSTEDNAYVLDHLIEPTPDQVPVAIMANPASSVWNDDVRAKLLATGQFTTVDVFNLNEGLPDLGTLEHYCGILTYTDFSSVPPDWVAWGDRLADYVDLTGGVVVGMFGHAGIPIEGRFVSEGYTVIEAASSQSGPETLGTVHEPTHPIMAGVTTFDGGTSSYRPATATVHTGTSRIADWTGGDDIPLIAGRTLGASDSSVRRADIGFYPPSDDVRSDFWDADGDGDLIMANALTWVARTCRGPRFVDGFESGGTTHWSTIGGHLLVTMPTGSGYDFSEQTAGSVTHGDFYYLYQSGLMRFFANNGGMRGLVDLGAIAEDLEEVVVPSTGYVLVGLAAVQGHTYVARAAVGEDDHYIIFRLNAVSAAEAALEWIYVHRP